jgi:hypothetical protein
MVPVGKEWLRKESQYLFGWNNASDIYTSGIHLKTGSQDHVKSWQRLLLFVSESFVFPSAI